MSLERLKSTLATGGEHLGDMIFWSLSEARVDRTTLESVWVCAGLDVALLPEPPTPEKALKHAIREAQVGQRDRLFRIGKEDETELIFGIVREQRPGDGSLTYTQEAVIRLDRHVETLTVSPNDHYLVPTICHGYQLLRSTHTPDDVRRAIVKTLHSFAAVTLREGGGVYWIPAPYAEKLRRLQQAIEKIGASRLYLLPVHKSADASQTLGEIAKSAIEQELDALKAEIDAFTKAPPDRASTLLRRFDSFESLRNKAKLYRDVLHIQVQDLDRQLDALSSAVEQMLNQKAA